ncbi:hypothetical protein Tdes44962_MAKER00916 [Teratosphaeria destructans]|uniref:Uncharacterized protein n=1 Tax=Teratosphaeria destructans TaxID=418781 RepID=A0A9W7VYC6_9PEZI|nr:hypothetical protein Tdes44962_MAKER00916 [Teratosphaeria destructans]
MRHVIQFLLRIIDCRYNRRRQLLQRLRQPVLFRRCLLRACTALGLGGDVAVGIEPAKGTVALLEDTAAFFDERFDFVDEILLIEFFFGCAVGGLHVLFDLLADWLYPLEGLRANVRHLLCDLALLLSLAGLLELLLSGALVLLLDDVLDERDLTNLIAIDVDDIAGVVDLLANAVAEITIGQLTHQVTILVTHFALLVDTLARHRVDTAFLLLRLPALSLADLVAVLVQNVSVLIDSVTHQLLDVTFDDTTNNVTRLRGNSAVLLDLQTFEAAERTFLKGVLTKSQLAATNDVTRIVPDLSLAIDLLTDQGGHVALDDFADNLAVAVDCPSRLVDLGTSQRGQVHLLLLFLLIRLSMALDITVLVDDVSIFVHSKTNQTLGIAFDKLANDIAVLVLDPSVFDDAQALETSEWSLALVHTLVLGNHLAMSDDLASVIVNVTVLVAEAASKLLDVTLDQATERNAILIDNIALLVQLLAIKNAVVNDLFLFFWQWLSMTLDIAVPVNNITVLIDSKSNDTLRIALDNLTDNIAILISNLAAFDDSKTLQTSKRTLRLRLTLLFRNELDTANDFTLVVPDLALVIELLASEVLGLALDQTSDWDAVIANYKTGLVELLALQERHVHWLLLRRLFFLLRLPALGMAND